MADFRTEWRALEATSALCNTVRLFKKMPALKKRERQAFSLKICPTKGPHAQTNRLERVFTDDGPLPQTTLWRRLRVCASCAGLCADGGFSHRVRCAWRRHQLCATTVRLFKKCLGRRRSAESDRSRDFSRFRSRGAWGAFVWRIKFAVKRNAPEFQLHFGLLIPGCHAGTRTSGGSAAICLFGKGRNNGREGTVSVVR
jgi:hypothetical protein